MKCIKCRHDSAPNANFCTACGFPASRGFLCAHCYQSLDDEDEVCPSCGQDRTAPVNPMNSAPGWGPGGAGPGGAGPGGAGPGGSGHSGPNQSRVRQGISPLTAGALAGIGGYLLGSAFARSESARLSAAPASGDFGSTESGFFGLDMNSDGATDAIMANMVGGPRLDTIVADLNHDGLADAIGMDLDEDGILDAVGLDQDQDGILETMGVDLDGNGVVDAVGVDMDEDGAIDVVGFDADEDGDFDFVSGDTDMDGEADWVAWDEDGDGTFDTALADFDGDGMLSEAELIDLDGLDADLGADLEADFGDFGDMDMDFEI